MVIKKTGGKGAVVATLAGLTAAAVGAYYLYGHKNAEKNRAKVKGWMLKAKGEVLEELEKIQDVTEPVYMGAVETVLRKYHELKTIDANEIEEFMTEMKNHWHGIQKTVGKEVKKVKAKAKKADKK